MKGDFTRTTFQKQKHYSSVRMQQGRLQLDADWNEQVDIQNHLMQTQVQDVVGQGGVPNTKENKDAFKITPVGKDFKISPGRIYVDGILCELDKDESKETTYKTQALYPNAAIADKIVDQNGEIQPGRYLAYLDVWQRHITAIEDPKIREVALNGTDTATRTQTITQVKLQRLGDSSASDNQWQDVLSTKQKRKAAIKASKATNSSILENNLYRVEIHKSGGIGEATFKWARNNATVVSAIESIKGKIITISSKNHEVWQSSQPDQWIEIIDEAHELAGKPGTLVRLEQVFDTQLVCDLSRIFDPNSLLKDIADATPQKLKVRRWDYTSDTTDTTNSGGIPIIKSQPIQLGNEGIQIEFFEDSQYETGDYWLIPTRAMTNDIEWASNSDAKKSYEGIQHHYCGLAILNYQGDRFDNTVSSNPNEIDQNADLRKSFLPLTEGAANSGNIGVSDKQKQAALHVQGAKAAVPSGKISPLPAQNTSETVSDVQVTVDPNLLQVGDTLIVNGQTTEITASDLGQLKVDPPIRIQTETDFAYQQPIARFSRLENNQDKTEVIITAQGRVGIGTASPRAQLAVQGPADQSVIARFSRLEKNQGKIQNKTELIITADGRVGIGTEEPKAKLSVQGPADQSVIARFLDANSNTKLIVMADGKVGIGTEIPTEALQVKGTIETDNLKLPPQSTFEVGTLKAGTIQLQNQSKLVYGTIQTGDVNGSKQIQFTANSTENNVEFAFLRNVSIATPDPNTTANLTIDGSVNAGDLVSSRLQLTNGGSLQGQNNRLLASAPLEVTGIVKAIGFEGNSLQFEQGNTTLSSRTAGGLSINNDVFIEKKNASANLSVNGQVNTATLSVTNTSTTGTLVINQALRFGNADIRQISTDNKFRDASDQALATQLAIKEYVDARLESSQPSAAIENPGLTAIDVAVKTLTITGNVTTAAATELQPGELSRLYVQGSAAQSGNVINIGSTLVRSDTALHVGDTITIEGESPRLITQAENSTFSFVPQFVTAPTADSLQYKQPIARFVDSIGESQLTITAEGLVVIGSFNSQTPVQFSTSLLETKLYVNGHIFGNTIRGNFQQISSRELKKDITQLSSQEVGQLLEELHPVKFTYTADSDEKVRVGFISEDAPDLVVSIDKKSISPLDIVAILTKAVQDQRQTTLTLSYLFDQQQQEISKLQEQVRMLERKANKKSWFR